MLVDVGAERWFLDRGLPTVLRPGALLHRLWSRSAPALAALAMIAVTSIAVVRLTGSHTIDIVGQPNLPEGVVLALVAVVLPAAGMAGRLVSRISSLGRRLLASNIAVALIVLGAVFGGPSQRLLVNLAVSTASIAIIVTLTATGIGSILGWVGELTFTNLASAAGMFVRALPVILLTFLVFFNSYVWLMTSVISRGRLWCGLIFLFLIAASFLVSSTLEEVRPILASPDPLEANPAGLAGTPFQNMPTRSDTDDPTVPPLSVLERANTVFVVAATQVVHVLTVAVLTGSVFFILGLILVSPEVLDAWTRGKGSSDGHLMGMTLPIPDSLIQTAMMLAAITFMYLAAKAATDTEYRSRFRDPILDDMRLTLMARGRYRSSALRRE